MSYCDPVCTCASLDAWAVFIHVGVCVCVCRLTVCVSESAGVYVCRLTLCVCVWLARSGPAAESSLRLLPSRTAGSTQRPQ